MPISVRVEKESFALSVFPIDDTELKEAQKTYNSLQEFPEDFHAIFAIAKTNKAQMRVFHDLPYPIDVAGQPLLYHVWITIKGTEHYGSN